MKENKGKRLQFVESIENHKETQKKIGEKQFQLVELIAEHKRLEKKSSECLAENSRLKQKIWYWSTKYKKFETNQDAVLSTKMKGLQDHITCLENEKLELLDKVQDFEKNCLSLFKKVQYANNVRAAYEAEAYLGLLQHPRWSAL